MRQVLRRRGIRAVVPERTDRKADRVRRGRVGGRPPAFDRKLCKARNAVGRCFARFKWFRAIVTRFDELAARYRAGLHLVPLILWLREPHQDHVPGGPGAVRSTRLERRGIDNTLCALSRFRLITQAAARTTPVCRAQRRPQGGQGAALPVRTPVGTLTSNR